MLIVVNYHYVRPTFEHLIPPAGFGRSRFGGIHGVSPDCFEAQLRLLGREGTFITAAQLSAAVRDGSTLPDRALLVTFDDGLQEQFDYARPVLQRLGIPALFFVNTGPVSTGTIAEVHKIHLLRAFLAADAFSSLLTDEGAEALPRASALTSAAAAEHYPYDSAASAYLKYALNFCLEPSVRAGLINRCFADVFGSAERSMSKALYMGEEELRTLAWEGELGTHTHHHLPLGLLPPAEAASEISQSIAYLASVTKRAVTCMSYPYGSETACPLRVGAAALKFGIDCAFTMERAGNQDLDCPLHLARFDCNDLPGGKHARFDAGSLFDRVPTARWRRRPVRRQHA